MKIKKLVTLLLFIKSFEICSGYRILSIFPLPKNSHFMLLNQLLKGLAQKGHQVDLMSVGPFKEQHPNYTQIIELPSNDDLSYDKYYTVKSIKYNFSMIAWMGHLRCELMGHPHFSNFMKNPPKYDLVIMQILNYNCFLVVGHLLNIPTVMVSSSSPYAWMYSQIGTPEYPAFIPNNMFPIPEGNHFWTRFVNTHIFNLIKWNFLYHSRNQNHLLEKFFGPQVPSVQDLEKNISLVLVNSHFSLNGVRPLSTGIIEVGGLHIQNDGPELSSSLKKWMDESKDGVIYLNLGSRASFDLLPERVVRVVFASLEKLAPMRIVMRVADPQKLPLKVPANVLPMPWIPQEKVLQHPNVKLFITHGGLHGTQEAVHYAVPMLFVPLVYDQWNNADICVRKRIAVKIDLMSVHEDELNHALNEILNNPIYRENIEKLSVLFKDRPESAIDTAVYWVEYVIRNGGGPLRSPLVELAWWQSALLDVYAVSILMIFAPILAVAFATRKCLRSRPKAPSTSERKKQN